MNSNPPSQVRSPFRTWSCNGIALALLLVEQAVAWVLGQRSPLWPILPPFGYLPHPLVAFFVFRNLTAYGMFRRNPRVPGYFAREFLINAAYPILIGALCLLSQACWVIRDFGRYLGGRLDDGMRLMVIESCLLDLGAIFRLNLLTLAGLLVSFFLYTRILSHTASPQSFRRGPTPSDSQGPAG